MAHRPTFNGPLAWSLLFIGATVIMIASTLPVLLAAAFAPAGEAATITEEVATLMERHDADLATYRERFNGRSVFFKPKQPPPPRRERAPAPPQPKPKPEDSGPPPPPPDPERPPYGGPAAKAVMADMVWFTGDIRLRVGDDPVNGLTLLSTEDAPWTVKVEHRGWDYDIPIFDRSDVLLASARPRAIPAGLESVPVPAEPAPAKPADEDAKTSPRNPGADDAGAEGGAGTLDPKLREEMRERFKTSRPGPAEPPADDEKEEKDP